LRDIRLKTGKLREELMSLDEEATLQTFGFYKPRYDFASSERYQLALEKVREEQKTMITNKTAAVCHTEWEVNGSRVEGRKQINQTLKLILRAFNGECDAAIAKVKYNNVKVMEARILKSMETVNRLVGAQQCYIAQGYLNLKLQELYLVHEYQEKVYEEKEEQRRIREQMRSERIAVTGARPGDHVGCHHPTLASLLSACHTTRLSQYQYRSPAEGRTGRRARPLSRVAVSI
jgi:hypothetical protein